MEQLNREIELLQLGFKKNYDQQTFYLYKYDLSWYVDYSKILDYSDHKWNILIEDMKYDLQESKKMFYKHLRMSSGYNLAGKDIRNKLRDEYNKYNSWLQQETQGKIGRSPNFKRETELRAKVELLKELIEMFKEEKKL
jgi:hypothetical protein